MNEALHIRMAAKNGSLNSDGGVELHDCRVSASIVHPRSVEPLKNANNSAVLHAINTGLVLIDCTPKCAFYMQNLVSWKQGKVVTFMLLLIAGT